jgi:hypothetical protein
MADFAAFATACEPKLWPSGAFADAYSANRDRAKGAMIEADAVASAVAEMMNSWTRWVGTATELLNLLTDQAGSAARDKDWPKSPRTLSNQLTRLQPLLRSRGVEIDRNRAGHLGTRIITIIRTI